VASHGIWRYSFVDVVISFIIANVSNLHMSKDGSVNAKDGYFSKITRVFSVETHEDISMSDSDYSDDSNYSDGSSTIKKDKSQPR
jgi:hypothetical protein